IAKCDAHPGLGQTIFTICGARFQTGLAKCSVALIDPDVILGSIIGNEQVRPPVAVQIGGNNSETWAERLIDSRADRDIAEPVAAIVMVKPRGNRRVRARRAVV